MERTTTLGGNLTAGSNNTNPVSAKVDSAAQAAHQTTDKIAGQTTAQVNRSAEAVHRAVDSAADTACLQQSGRRPLPNKQSKHRHDSQNQQALRYVRVQSPRSQAHSSSGICSVAWRAGKSLENREGNNDALD
jgi:hypothetical protein